MGSVSCWKEAENGLVAHIYEHIASSYITSHLVDKGLYFVADFDHWAHTYGTFFYLNFCLHSKQAQNELEAVLRDFSETNITYEMVKKAVAQISSEYKRPVVYLNETILGSLKSIHVKPWRDVAQLPAMQAETGTSANTTYESRGIAFGEIDESLFIQRALYLDIDENYYANSPPKKALAVLVLQAIALNMHEFLGRDIIFYDAGDEWNEGAPTVAYRTHLQFTTRDAPTLDELQGKVDEFMKTLANSSFSIRVKELLKKSYKHESAQYFSLEAMNRITDGITLGYAGWRSVADEHSIDNFVKHTYAEVVGVVSR